MATEYVDKWAKYAHEHIKNAPAKSITLILSLALSNMIHLHESH